MKKTLQKTAFITLLGVLLIIFSTTSYLFSQTDSLTTQPLFPNNTEETQLICHMNLSSSPCYLDSSYVELKNDTIHLKLFYVMGAAVAICERVDTLNLGVLDLGSYTIKAEKYYLHISDSIVYNTIYLDVNVGYLSIDDIASNSLNLYPNPTNDYVNVSFLDESYNLVIYDILGREMKRIDKNEIINNNLKINISNYPKGMYLFVFEQNDKKVLKKLIKN